MAHSFGLHLRMACIRRALCLVLLFCSGLAAAGKKEGKKEKKTAGSEKCEKGIFGSLVKDPTVPLCDAHFPDDKAKSGWLVLFYKKDAVGLQDVMNRVATDLGNEPPEKSKSLKKKPKKQRARIKDLAEKYEFEANIPKKGLEEKGKEPLLKAGAVCCDCSSEEQALCKSRELGIRLIQPKMAEKVMPGGEDAWSNTEKIVHWTMGELGFVKGVTADAVPETKGEPEAKKTKGKAEKAKDSDTKPEDLKQKLEDLKAKKAKAIADEDFKLASKLKKDITELEEKLKSSTKAEDPASLKEQIEKLKEEKKKAAADEDFELAGKLKQDIADLEGRLKGAEL